MLHADTDANVDTGLSACGGAVSEHCEPITKCLFLNMHYLSSFHDEQFRPTTTSKKKDAQKCQHGFENS